MEITEVKLTRVRGDDKLKAFVSITFDNAFVVRDLKIIKGRKGEFVAMPSRKLTEHCPKCGRKNNVYSAYCGTCGEKLPRQNPEDSSRKIYADIAHPINADCRSMIQNRVLEEFRKLEASGKPLDEDRGEKDAGPLDFGDETVAKDSSSAEDADDDDDLIDGIW